MKRSTRIQLIVLTLILVTFLSACGGSGGTIYEQPIGSGEGSAWFQWIIEQLADFTYWISTLLGGNYWVGLIVVTLLVRSIGWPIYSKSNAMQLNMQQAQPELNKMQEKYKGKTDEASQRKQQQETMEIYKKYNINPLGCLLPFLQMPIFIAMYQVVRRLPLSLGQAAGVKDYSSLNYHFLGLNLNDGVDFSMFGTDGIWAGLTTIFPDILLAILVGALMFGYQKYAQSKPEYMKNKKFDTVKQNSTANQMKYMSYFMVIMLVSIAVTNNGIALYWIVGNAFQFFQTYINRKSNYKHYLESKNDIIV